MDTLGVQAMTDLAATLDEAMARAILMAEGGDGRTSYTESQQFVRAAIIAAMEAAVQAGGSCAGRGKSGCTAWPSRCSYCRILTELGALK